MFRILVANSKGGCGKTTLTSTLAGWYAHAGRRTTLLDCDPQASSLAWCKQRPAHRAALRALASNDPAHGLGAGWVLRLPGDTEILLIDTPAGLRSHEFAQFARHADVLLVPVVPSPLDLRATLGFLDTVRRLPEVRQGRLRVGLVANRLRERALSTRELDATLGRMTQIALARIRDSQLYVKHAAVGSSLFEDDSAAARQHQADWAPLLAWLDQRAAERAPAGKVAFLSAARDVS
jgi:chromosome partitioning protein